MDDEHENDDENNDDSRIERDSPTGELPHGVDAERAGKPVPADEKPSRDVNDRPGENGEGQGEITSPNGEELARALSVLVQSGGLGTILRHAFDGSCVGSVNMCCPVSDRPSQMVDTPYFFSDSEWLLHVWCRFVRTRST